MTSTHDIAVGTAISASAGISYLELTGNYYQLAIAGAIIGLINWFYNYTHSANKGEKMAGVSEAIKNMLFGLLVMPSAIDLSSNWLVTIGIPATPSVKILVGALAAFFSVEIVAFLKHKFLNPMIKKDK